MKKVHIPKHSGLPWWTLLDRFWRVDRTVPEREQRDAKQRWGKATDGEK